MPGNLAVATTRKPINFGLIVAEARKERGISRQVLARAIQRSDEAVRRIEEGKLLPSSPIVRRITQTLGLEHGRLAAQVLIARKKKLQVGKSIAELEGELRPQAIQSVIRLLATHFEISEEEPLARDLSREIEDILIRYGL